MKERLLGDEIRGIMWEKRDSRLQGDAGRGGGCKEEEKWGRFKRGMVE